MRHWKKMIVLASIAMLAFGAIAYAHGGWGWGSGHMMGMSGYGHMMGSMTRGGQGYRTCGSPGFHRQGVAGGWESAPEEFQNRMKDLQRTRLELQLALTEEPVDTKRATELHEKMLKLHEEMARWHFDQILTGTQGDTRSD